MRSHTTTTQNRTSKFINATTSAAKNTFTSMIIGRIIVLVLLIFVYNIRYAIVGISSTLYNQNIRGSMFIKDFHRYLEHKLFQQRISDTDAETTAPVKTKSLRQVKTTNMNNRVNVINSNSDTEDNKVQEKQQQSRRRLGPISDWRSSQTSKESQEEEEKEENQGTIKTIITSKSISIYDILPRENDVADELQEYLNYEFNYIPGNDIGPDQWHKLPVPDNFLWPHSGIVSSINYCNSYANNLLKESPLNVILGSSSNDGESSNRRRTKQNECNLIRPSLVLDSIYNDSNDKDTNKGKTVKPKCTISDLDFSLTPYGPRSKYNTNDDSTTNTCQRPTLILPTDNANTQWTLSDIQMKYRSEHMLLGRQYDAEMQFVHVPTSMETGEVLSPRARTIFSLMVDATSYTRNDLFEEYLLRWEYVSEQNHLHCNNEEGSSSNTQPSPSSMLAYDLLFSTSTDLSYVEYEGTLTIPPCNPGIKWHILTKPLLITKTQYRRLTSLTSKDKFVNPLSCKTGTALSPQGTNNRPIFPSSSTSSPLSSLLEGRSVSNSYSIKNSKGQFNMNNVVHCQTKITWGN